MTTKQTAHSIGPIEIPSDIDFNRFHDGAIIAGETVTEHIVGEINFPTGRILACDPAEHMDAHPYTRTIKPGSYLLTLYSTGKFQTNELAKLTFSETPADKWIFAYTQEDAPTILEGNLTGIPVDTALCCIMDDATSRAYNSFVVEFTKDNPDADLWGQLIEPKNNNAGTNNNWTKIKVPNSEYGFYMFNSGYGDGVYPAFWGMSDDSEIVSFVIDFDPHR